MGATVYNQKGSELETIYGGDKLLKSLAEHIIKTSPNLDENSMEEY